MKKIFTILVYILSATLVFGHNPLQGTKWVMNDEKGKAVFTIDFETGNTGILSADKQNCEFTYGANHTHLFIKMNKCEPVENNSGIIPCCEQQSIEFRGDEEGNLILIIGENEYLLKPVR